MQPVLIYSAIGIIALIALSYGKTAKGLSNLKVSLYNPLKIWNKPTEIVKNRQLQLNLSLRIVNSGTSDVTINNISGLVQKKDGSLLATFNKRASQEAWVCKGNGNVTIIENLIVSIELWDTVQNLAPIFKKGLPIKLSGTLVGEGNALPFAFESTLQVDITNIAGVVIDTLEAFGLDKAANAVDKLVRKITR